MTSVHVTLDALAYGDRPVGVGRYVATLLRGLAAEEHDLRLSLVVRHGARAALAALAAAAGAEMLGPGTVASNGPARLLWEQLRLPALADRRGADLVHGLMGVVPATGRAAKVVTVHDATFLSHPELHTRTKVRYFHTMLPRAVRAARLVITDSAASRRELARHLPVDPRRVRVVPLCPDPSFVPPPEAEVAAARRRFDLDDRFVLFAGVLEPRKNLARLIAAMARLRADGHAAELVLAGKPGWHRHELDEVLRHAPWVRPLGYVSDDDLRALLAACAAFAYVPLIEGFGLPVAEAMAVGAPVVTSAVSSLPEVAGGAAELVSPTEVGSIAAGLARVLSDDRYADELRGRGRRRAGELNPARLARETVAVYREALAT